MVEEAIILAAGFGSRLRNRAASKPLAQICGVSLIEIGIRQTMAAGVKHIAVVTGHKGEQVESELHRISQIVEAQITPVRLEDWSKPNGWSVIAGSKAVSGPFLLMMADHIFGDGLLLQLAGQSLEKCDAVLACDSIDNPLIDPDDATWVATGTGNHIARIGKEIAPYDVVDCGAFLANHNLPRAIEEAIADGAAGSLSEGMQVLADQGRAEIRDIGGIWWIDVDDPRAHDLACEQAGDHLGWLSAKGNKGANL